jgi:hypothetical protein
MTIFVILILCLAALDVLAQAITLGRGVIIQRTTGTVAAELVINVIVIVLGLLALKGGA